MVLIPRPPLAGDLVRPRLLQCQEDARRFATRAPERATHEINAILNGLDAQLGAIVRMRRDFGPDPTDAEQMAVLVAHAAAAIERHEAVRS